MYGQPGREPVQTLFSHGTEHHTLWVANPQDDATNRGAGDVDRFLPKLCRWAHLGAKRESEAVRFEKLEPFGAGRRFDDQPAGNG